MNITLPVLVDGHSRLFAWPLALTALSWWWQWCNQWCLPPYFLDTASLIDFGCSVCIENLENHCMLQTSRSYERDLNVRDIIWKDDYWVCWSTQKSGMFYHPLIFTLFNLTVAMGVLVPIPADYGRQLGCTPKWSPTNYGVQTETIIHTHIDLWQWMNYCSLPSMFW